MIRSLNAAAKIGALLVLVMAGMAWQPSPASATPLLGITDIAVGSGHVCAVLSDGVRCWGRGLSGQLGNGTLVNSSLPVDVIGLSDDVIAIDAGGDGGVGQTCIVTSTGGVKCWGSNFRGQVGDGTQDIRKPKPVDVVGLASGVMDVAAGDTHTCALMSSGDVKCWGDNFYGQLGDGTRTSTTTPVDVKGLAGITVEISAGVKYTCARNMSGGVQCWGSNHSGRLGAPVTEDCGVVTCTTIPTYVTGLQSGIADIATGDGHTCALTTLGGVKCWGRNQWGQLGNGTTTPASEPADVSGLTSGVVSISTGDDHVCAKTNSNTLKCWGYNVWGQLGDGTSGLYAHSTTPVDVIGLGGQVSLLAAGGVGTCAILVEGNTQCWGHALYGDIGDGRQCGPRTCTIPTDVLLRKPTPTPTITPTPTNTPTPADTPTPTSTATPGGPEMLLTIEGEDCDDPPQPPACSLPVGARFTLAVEALVAPMEGYVGIQTFVDFGADLVYKPTDDPADELTWPDCDVSIALRDVFVREGQVRGWIHGCLSGLLLPFPTSTYIGSLVRLSVTCSSEPSTSLVRLIPFGHPPANSNGTMFILPSGNEFVPAIDELTIHCVAPAAVGGVALDADAGLRPLNASDSSNSGFGERVWAIAAVVSAAALGGAAWYVRRRVAS